MKVKGDTKQRRQLFKKGRKCASMSICRLRMIVLFICVTQHNRCFHCKLELVRAQPYVGSRSLPMKSRGKRLAHDVINTVTTHGVTDTDCQTQKDRAEGCVSGSFKR